MDTKFNDREAREYGHRNQRQTQRGLLDAAALKTDEDLYNQRVRQIDKEGHCHAANHGFGNVEIAQKRYAFVLRYSNEVVQHVADVSKPSSSKSGQLFLQGKRQGAVGL